MFRSSYLGLLLRKTYITINNIKIMNKIIKNALIDSFGTAAYIVLVVSFIFSLRILAPKEDTIIIPIAMLLLFVFSAALTGTLVFGKPILWYIDGKKKEAISLVGYTLGFLFIITILVFMILIAFQASAI